MTAALAPAPARERITVTGVVQGVGFRPFVFRVATMLGLRGWVRNSPGGAEILAVGDPPAIGALVEALRRDAPPPAVVETIRREAAPGEAVPPAFRLAASEQAGELAPGVPPDLALCDACTRELRDPADRRYRYPFTTCAHCGPRYSIITALPFDRARTTMAAFPLCPRCRAEFEDPGNRRFHAQAIACPDCGPSLVLSGADGRVRARGDGALAAACACLHRGGIVALKGLGGYQLLAAAGSDDAIAALRARKARPRKPFALMLPSLDAARSLCAVEEREAAALASPEAPIVLLRSRGEPAPGAPAVSAGVAPDNPYRGVMLPCTPLHHLLLDDFGDAVVATSGNRPGEPLCHREADALQRLAAIADCFLSHDRPIARALDDSVVQFAAGDLQLLRRARGYVPRPLSLPLAARRELLAVGAQHRNTVAFARGRRAFLSQHLGDLDSVAALAAHRAAAEDLAQLLGLQPERVIHDTHPDYASTRAARGRGLPTAAVPHHTAHVFAALAEHGIGPKETVFAAAWDGTGLGDDGTLWGGELFRVGAGHVRRTGCLRPFRLPGGEGAIRFPYRTALAVLRVLDDAGEGLPGLAACPAGERRLLARLLETGLRSPQTTSAGRLFDAAASLLGLCQAVSFDGEAAQQLQFAAEDARDRGEPVPAAAVKLRPGSPAILDWAPALASILAAYRAGASAGACALAFHRALGEGLAAGFGNAADSGVDTVLLTGGCFQNRLLAEAAAAALEARGYRVLLARRVPANDGGIALGQLWAAVHAEHAATGGGDTACA
ncbi:MAG: carbamoyltransferase HypF [Pseudohaliea sp.]